VTFSFPIDLSPKSLPATTIERYSRIELSLESVLGVLHRILQPYTKRRRSEPMRPVAQSDGHDAVGLIDKLVQMIKLPDTESIIVGIQPGVAFAMVQLGSTLEHTTTALSLEEGLALSFTSLSKLVLKVDEFSRGSSGAGPRESAVADRPRGTILV
jgi:hypothetical protein